jgi:hypothetical protein
MALIASVLLLLSMLWMKRRAKAHAHRTPDDALDTVQSWPPQAVRVMTLPERQAYEILRRAQPRNLILAQVPLQRFISVSTQHRYSEWLQRVGRHTVDLLVCDGSSRVLAAVEIRSADESERSRARHERINQVLQAAGVTVHSWDEAALPGAAQVRQLFSNKDDVQDMGPDGRPVIPVADAQEVLAALDDLGPGAPAQEPVSSDYFDDLEAVLPGARSSGAQAARA